MEDNNKFFGKRFDDVVRKLADYETYSELFHISKHDIPMPSVDELREIMELIRSVIFPGYFRNSEINRDIVAYYTGAKIDRIYRGFCEQIKRGFCFCCQELVDGVCLDCERKAQTITELL